VCVCMPMIIIIGLRGTICAVDRRALNET